MSAWFPKKAMVLAAGRGTRMREHTTAVPKPLVEIAGQPLVDWSLDMLFENGIEHVVVNTHHMAPLLEEHLAKRTRPQIAISHEEELLDTGGGIKNALKLLGDEPFFVMNSDVICLNGASPYLKRLADAWDEATMDALLLVTPCATASGYKGQGDFSIESDGILQRRGVREVVPYIFSGIQLLHPRLFANAPEGAFSMNVLYNVGIDEKSRLDRTRGLVHDGTWFHVGDKEGVLAAEHALKERCHA